MVELPHTGIMTNCEANNPEYPPGEDPARWRILGVVLAAIFMSLISVSIVNVALPSIKAGMHADNSSIQWVLSGYTLTFGVVLVAAGRAGDLLGRGGMFLIGVVVYTTCSAAAGFAPNAEALNAARFAQGVGAGLLNPQGVGMIQQYFRGRERGTAFGYFGSTVGIAVAIGPVLGGFLIKLGGPDLGWRLTFLVNMPFGILAIILGLLWFPRPLLSHVRDSRTGEPVGLASTIQQLDPIGALLLGAAVLLVLIPFAESGADSWVWALLPCGALCVAAWIAWEKHLEHRGAAPMINLGIFTVPSFRNGSLLAGLWFLGITSIWVLVAIYFQNALGHSALVAGTVGIPAAICSAVSANIAGRFVVSRGRPIVVAGMIAVVGGLLATIGVIYAVHAWGLSEWFLMVPLTLVGAGQGSVISPNQTLTLADVPVEYAGVSGAVLQTGQRIGTSIGLTAVTAVTFAVTGSTSWSSGIIAGFSCILVVCLASLAVGLIDMKQRRKAPINQRLRPAPR